MREAGKTNCSREKTTEGKTHKEEWGLVNTTFKIANIIMIMSDLLTSENSHVAIARGVFGFRRIFQHVRDISESRILSHVLVCFTFCSTFQLSFCSVICRD